MWETRDTRLERMWLTFRTAAWNLAHRLTFTDMVDILIVAVVVYELIMLVRQTRGSAVLKGLLFLVLATWISSLFGFTALNWMLNGVLSYGALVLVVLFQPELRRALEQMGRGSLFELGHKEINEEDSDVIISEIIQCMNDLSRRRVGALIVFERKTGLNDVIETGTKVDGRISAPLLENIFEPNTPLHDGAVVVRGTRVVAAACILPLTENQGVSRELGTRHRAAIGVGETTDAICLIVSEETGVMSMTEGGRITRHMDATSIRKVLEGIYTEQHKGIRKLIQQMRAGKEKAA